MFIFPDMGDGGNAYGAAAYSYFQENKLNFVKTNNIYFGPEFSNKYIENMLIQNDDKVEYFLSTNVCKDSAKLKGRLEIVIFHMENEHSI